MCMQHPHLCWTIRKIKNTILANQWAAYTYEHTVFVHCFEPHVNPISDHANLPDRFKQLFLAGWLFAHRESGGCHKLNVTMWMPQVGSTCCRVRTHQRDRFHLSPIGHPWKFGSRTTPSTHWQSSVSGRRLPSSSKYSMVRPIFFSIVFLSSWSCWYPWQSTEIILSMHWPWQIYSIFRIESVHSGGGSHIDINIATSRLSVNARSAFLFNFPLATSFMYRLVWNMVKVTKTTRAKLLRVVLSANMDMDVTYMCLPTYLCAWKLIKERRWKHSIMDASIYRCQLDTTASCMLHDRWDTQHRAMWNVINKLVDSFID